MIAVCTERSRADLYAHGKPHRAYLGHLKIHTEDGTGALSATRGHGREKFTQRLAVPSEEDNAPADGVTTGP